MPKINDLRCSVVKEFLEKYLGKPVRLVKDDDFVISGVIKEICNDSIIFYTDNKTVLLTFDRIKEIVPLQRRG